MTICNDTVSNYVRTATADDATPDVTNVACLITANANPTTITNFDGGVNGQQLTVVIGDNILTTLKHDSGTGTTGPILLNLGADYPSCALGEVFCFIKIGGIWREFANTHTHSLMFHHGETTPSDATPSVANISSLITRNANPTSITNFDGGTEGQLLTVIIGDAVTTLVHDSATGGNGPILLNSGVTLACTAGQVFQFFLSGTVWCEVNSTHTYAMCSRQKTATADDATPNVTNTSCLVTANANATSITDFDGGVNGQLLTVMINDAVTTLKHDVLTGNAGLLMLAGAADIVCAAGQTYQFMRVSGIWHEITDSRIIPPAE